LTAYAILEKNTKGEKQMSQQDLLDKVQSLIEAGDKSGAMLAWLKTQAVGTIYARRKIELFKQIKKMEG
jgi:hypothetical protein